eukprot:1582518-Rhodomonas_salina.2
MSCPVLKEVASLPGHDEDRTLLNADGRRSWAAFHQYVAGTWWGQVKSPICLCLRYAMSGIDAAYGGAQAAGVTPLIQVDNPLLALTAANEDDLKRLAVVCVAVRCLGLTRRAVVPGARS